MLGKGVRVVLCFAWALGGCSRVLGLEPPEPWLESDASAGGGGASGSAGDAGASGSAGDAGASGVAGGAGQSGGSGGTGGQDGGSEDGGDAGCMASAKSCGSQCVAVDDPAFGCTPQGCEPCTLDHATAKCNGTACAVSYCDLLWGDCDGEPENGCEEDLTLGPAARCNGKVAETCDVGGQWTEEACGIGCEDGECLHVVDLAAGGNHTCSILSNGEVWCWGDNGKGQLGIGSTNPSSSTSPQRVQELNSPAQVSLGMSSTCVVNAAKELRCWGDNSAGQLGTGDNLALFAPSSGPTLTEIDHVDAGTWNTVCVFEEDLTVLCFGAPMASFAPGVYPTEVQEVNGPHLAVGTGFVCADSVDGLKCWGDDGAGQLGNGEPKQNSPVPVIVSVSASWGGVGAGDASSYAFTTNGKVYAWGGNSHGQLGMSGTDRSSPTEVPIPTSVEGIDSVDGGFRHACVAGRDDQNQRVVYCFGSNDKGELGQGSIGGTSAVPKQVLAGPGTALRASRVAVGWQHNCAIVSGGKEIVCWGLNEKGQLGDGTNTSQGYPVRVVFP